MGAGGATADRVLADLSDAVLICRTRTGDAAAYRLLYERHAAAARGLARHFVNSEAAAEEAVSETFARVLTVLWRGGGPQEGFRPYLLTSVRRTLHHHHHDNDHGRSETYDPAEPLVEPGLEDLAPNMIARAFRSLPERWQAVLWHTEIEGQRPAEVAPLLGLPANQVAALGYRAREGLRQAYLQIHLAETARRGCRPALDKLAAYVRGGVARRESAQVERHLAGCTDCQASYAELADLKTGLRTVVGPLILGTAATAYFTGSPATALGGRFGAWRQVPRRRLQTFGAGAATIGAMAALGLVLAAQEEPDKEVRPGRPPATAPAVPVPGQSEATKP